MGGLGIVVRDGTPEVRLQRLCQQFFAVGDIGSKLAAFLVKNNAEGIIFNGERRIGIDVYKRQPL